MTAAISNSTTAKKSFVLFWICGCGFWSQFSICSLEVINWFVGLCNRFIVFNLWTVDRDDGFMEDGFQFVHEFSICWFDLENGFSDCRERERVCERERERGVWMAKIG
ncbi:hypothetical protein RHGRI_001133 [Rhododendron griersonianum]|uniref:Uncharacterized protein n=1 Tax=Rhododendron griersonianum TaxID=479676 RepID=A0AAV6LJ37_9ERIC|nr:hypothetical protein RHGRI_001133 [Rhododendron griersonianum]